MGVIAGMSLVAVDRLKKTRSMVSAAANAVRGCDLAGS